MVTRSRQQSNNTRNCIITSKTKRQVLSCFVNKLVQQKMKSKLKQNRLNKKSYIDALKEIKSIGIHWITLNALKFRVLREYKKEVMRNNALSCPPPPGEASNNTSNTSSTQTTMIDSSTVATTNRETKLQLQRTKEKAKNKITELYYLKMTECKTYPKTRMPQFTYNRIMVNVMNEFNLDKKNFNFPYDSCKSRIQRGNILSRGVGRKSPLKDVEPKFIDIILSMADIGCPVSVGETILLINSLIKDTPAQDRLVRFQKQILQNKGTYDLGLSFLGHITKNYYYGFMGRHKNIIESNKGRRFEIARQNWTNYRNFLNMYLDIERMLIDANIATKLPSPSWMDENGIPTQSEDAAYGCKVSTQLDFPQCCIVMDEVGADLNMLNDGAIGGTKFISRKGNIAKMNATKKSKRFTTLGLTNLCGDAIMCVIIFEGKERSIIQESGIDPFHPLYNEYEHDHHSTKESNFSFFEENYGPGNLFPGGPICEFEGKLIPCMIRYSENGSITPDILRDILKTLDELNIFKEYRDKGVTPFLLVDGHQSRFHTKFLEYITNEEHPWKVSIGVPYGTSLWQVGDSYQQNGRYKVTLMKSKKLIMDRRIEYFISDMELTATDVIPMINLAWEASFADKSGNAQAIRERGFNPLNKKLLQLEELRRTMTDTDKQEEKSLNLVTDEMISMLNSDPNSNDSDQNRINSLNFNCGYAASVIDKLVGHVDLERARSRNNAKAVFGQNTKSLLKDMKKLTSAGQLVRVAHTHELGMDLLTEVRLRKAENERIEFGKFKRKRELRFEVMDRYLKLKSDKSEKDERKWGNNDLKIAIRALKNESDGKLPTKKSEMIVMWEKIKCREDLMREQHKVLLKEIEEEENM